MAILTGNKLLEILQSHTQEQLEKPIYVAVDYCIIPYSIVKIEAKEFYISLEVTRGLGE